MVDYHAIRVACAAGGGVTCGVMQDDECSGWRGLAVV
jgi:hypothetical protein